MVAVSLLAVLVAQMRTLATTTIMRLSMTTPVTTLHAQLAQMPMHATTTNSPQSTMVAVSLLAVQVVPMSMLAISAQQQQSMTTHVISLALVVPTLRRTITTQMPQSTTVLVPSVRLKSLADSEPSGIQSLKPAWHLLTAQPILTATVS